MTREIAADIFVFQSRIAERLQGARDENDIGIGPVEQPLNQVAFIDEEASRLLRSDARQSVTSAMNSKRNPANRGRSRRRSR
jgi:hypothetical protein